MKNKQENLFFENELYQRVEQSLRAIKHSLRHRMVALIHQNEMMPATEIYRQMKIEQAVASSHLVCLRREGYLNAKKVERYVFYSVNYNKIKGVEKISQALAGMED